MGQAPTIKTILIVQNGSIGKVMWLETNKHENRNRFIVAAQIDVNEHLSAIEVRVIPPSPSARAHMFWPLAIKAVAE